MTPVGIRSIAVRFPSIVRTNEYYSERFPEVIKALEEQAIKHVFNGADATELRNSWDIEMAPYMRDPFRGAVERRLLGPGETTLSLEQQAAEEALAAANMRPEEVDLLICSSFVPERHGIGDAALLAGRLGLGGAAFNQESACASALVALQTACALVRSGEYRNVLVVVSTTYSRVNDEADVMSWWLGDGAGAFLVGPVETDYGLLAVKSLHTADTCNTFYMGLTKSPDGEPVVRMRAEAGTAKVLRDASQRVLQACCVGAAEAAGVRLRDIDFFVFNTPIAWYHQYAVRALEVDPAKTLTTYTAYANVGSALPVVNLYHAAEAGLVREGSLVLVYAIGSVSSAAAAVMRWSKVGLGSMPAPSPALIKAGLVPSLQLSVA
jgi:3-oxoacyl-[acyl-carrier-protein] synthase-3